MYYEESRIAIDPSLVVLALANFTAGVLRTVGEYDRALASELQIKIAHSLRSVAAAASASQNPSVADFEVQFLAYGAQRDKAPAMASRPTD